jgi:alpha-tubulin suppressor-like RCC1 family protein
LILKGHKALKVQGGHKFSMIWADQNKIFTLGNNKFGQCGFNNFKIPEVN